MHFGTLSKNNNNLKVFILNLVSFEVRLRGPNNYQIWNKIHLTSTSYQLLRHMRYANIWNQVCLPLFLSLSRWMSLTCKCKKIVPKLLIVLTKFPFQQFIMWSSLHLEVINISLQEGLLYCQLDYVILLLNNRIWNKPPHKTVSQILQMAINTF